MLKATSEQYRPLAGSIDAETPRGVQSVARISLLGTRPKQPFASIGRQAAMHPQKESDAVGICGAAGQLDRRG